jgi:hypothetical protein
LSPSDDIKFKNGQIQTADRIVLLVPGKTQDGWNSVAIPTSNSQVYVAIDHVRFGDSDEGGYAPCHSTTNSHVKQASSQTQNIVAQPQPQYQQSVQQQNDERQAQQQRQAEINAANLRQQEIRDKMNRLTQSQAAIQSSIQSSIASIADMLLSNMYRKRIEEDNTRRNNHFNELKEQVSNNSGELNDCEQCNGSGYIDCGECNGDGSKICLACNGTGSTTNFQGTVLTCTYCFGKGKQTCTACYGLGKKQCSNCIGTGKIFKIS